MIIKNGRIITMDENFSIVENGAIRISDGLIDEIGNEDDISNKFPGEQVVDVEGKLIMPGNICGHTHFCGAYARGLATAGEAPSCFIEILDKLWWRLDKALTPKGVRSSAHVCVIDAIRHGTTTLIDHHASPSCVEGSLDIIADVTENAGLRTCLSYEVSDRNGKKDTSLGIQENIRFMKRCQAESNPLLAGTFGLHASLTLSDSTLETCVQEASCIDGGFHIHAAEDLADQTDCLKKTGMRVVERLNSIGILGPRSLLAHCIHIDSNEMDILAETGTFVTHQPRSNMNNAVGTAPVEEMLAKGINVSIGNDGFSNNMWSEWKTAYLIHKLVQGDPRRCQGFDIMKMGVTNNRKLVETYWPDQIIGSLVPGGSADLILVDYKGFTPLTAGNLPWHILFGFEADMVHSTMVRGKWLMKE
ncbi:putative aminohydrolase SsnA, partial [bacterium]|nr:putative aminohydrolase SsnA [bacterium]